jgi:hypothetical protein
LLDTFREHRRASIVDQLAAGPLCPLRDTRNALVGKIRFCSDPIADRRSTGRSRASKSAVYAAFMACSEFWQLRHFTNSQLLDSLGRVLRTQRQSLAEVVAHLGEVEERRLHLEAAYGSLFDYCVRKLAMSEDEACRRIDLARLTRQFPALFPLLASGELTLSAALLLKGALTPDNQLELIHAARCKSIREVREMLAARFPSPDVPPTIRKLPQPAKTPAPAVPPSSSPIAPPPAARPPRSPPAGSQPLHLHPPAPQQRIEPIAAERYKLQLTIDATIKSKLEQARDLLRHAHPSGDLAAVLSRALDLLIADQLRHRFGAGARRRAQRAPATATTPSHISNAARRAVLDRDGLACTWVDANGTRCSSRAWLELDHRHPRGKGGASDAENLRLLCRAHNLLAAEHAYGRAHVERAKAARRARDSTVPP